MGYMKRLHTHAIEQTRLAIEDAKIIREERRLDNVLLYGSDIEMIDHLGLNNGIPHSPQPHWFSRFLEWLKK